MKLKVGSLISPKWVSCECGLITGIYKMGPGLAYRVQWLSGKNKGFSEVYRYLGDNSWYTILS